MFFQHTRTILSELILKGFDIFIPLDGTRPFVISHKHTGLSPKLVLPVASETRKINLSLQKDWQHCDLILVFQPLEHLFWLIPTSSFSLGGFLTLGKSTREFLLTAHTTPDVSSVSTLAGSVLRRISGDQQEDQQEEEEE